MLRKKENKHKQEKRNAKFNFFVILFILFFLPIICFAKEIENKDPLSAFEERVFRVIYSKENEGERLSRLESFLFGKEEKNKSTEERLEKISNALRINKPKKIEEPPVESNSGVFSVIKNIEKDVFNKTFENLPFQRRIENLENKMLNTDEAEKNKLKPLIERVSILAKRVGGVESITTDEVIKPQNKPQDLNYNKENINYRIDPNTGFIVNELTGDILKDESGNPIMVKIPSPVYPQYNNQYPYNPNSLDPSQNQLFNPYQYLFNNQEYGQ